MGNRLSAKEARGYINSAQPDGTYTEQCILKALAQGSNHVAVEHIRLGLVAAMRFGAAERDYVRRMSAEA